MQISTIKLLYKTNDKQQISNYRSISLLPQISKNVEKIIFNRLSKYIFKHNIINKNQYGFISQIKYNLILLNIQNIFYINYLKTKSSYNILRSRESI